MQSFKMEKVEEIFVTTKVMPFENGEVELNMIQVMEREATTYYCSQCYP